MNYLLLAVFSLNLHAATTESVNDEAIERAAETLIKENAENPILPKTAAKNEEDTPVVMSEPAAPKSGGSLVWRLLASVVVLAALGLGLTLVSRRWTRRADRGGLGTRIELMHQFHLGPRKSVALVRVAGECLLLGVTDQNVNMLKTITIIDADMEAALNQDFNAFLGDEFSVADVNAVVGERS